MGEDLEASITQWQKDLYATKVQDIDGGPPIDGIAPITGPDFTRRDNAEINLRFTIQNNSQYGPMAREALGDGLAQREIVDSRIEGTDFKIGCLAIYYGVLVGGAAIVYGAIELAKWLSS